MVLLNPRALDRARFDARHWVEPVESSTATQVFTQGIVVDFNNTHKMNKYIQQIHWSDSGRRQAVLGNYFECIWTLPPWQSYPWWICIQIPMQEERFGLSRKLSRLDWAFIITYCRRRRILNIYLCSRLLIMCIRSATYYFYANRVTMHQEPPRQ